MPETLDLDEIGRAAGAPDQSLDLDSIGRASPADDIIQREQRKFGLWQQKNLAALEGSRAGALADVIGSVVEPAVQAARDFPANVINLPSTLTGGFPIVGPGQPTVQIPATIESIREAIVQNPVLAGSILGANPELSAGVLRGGLDVAESFTTPENLLLLGTLPKAAPSVQRPVSAAFATQMGLDVPEAAARLGEAMVTQPPAEQIRQATALGVNVALPLQMTLHPEIAARRASEAEAVRLEGTRLQDYFAQRRAKERAAQQAAEEERLLGSDPFRRIAAETARQQGIPVGAQQPTVGGQSAIPIQSATTIPVRETPVSGQTVGAGVRRAEELAGTGPQAGARSGGVARETVPIPAPKEGDIVELYGHVGELGRDEEGRAVIKTERGLVEIPEGGVPVVRLAVTPEGKIVRNGVLFEPSIGAGKEWWNAYTPEKNWLRIRKVGDGIRLVLSGPSADYVVARLSALQPRKPPTKPVRAPKLPEEATTVGAGETEATTVDTPVDEFIFNTGLARELAENKAARIEVKNNKAIDLPEFPLERMRRHPAPQPHSGDIAPARMLYNPSGPSAGYLNFLRGKHYSYRIPLSELPTGSWGKLPGGAWFDKRAILAFLSNNERRFANRNASGENEYFTSGDIDIIRGVTTKKPTGTVPAPGRPRATVTGNVSLDQPAGEEGTVGNILTAEPRYISRMTGIVKRTFDNLLKDQPELFNDLLDKPVEQLDEAFWGRVREAIAAQEEFKGKPAEAVDLMLNHLRMRKETPGGFGEQGSIQGRTYVRLREVGNFSADDAARLRAFERLIEELPREQLMQIFLEGRIRRIQETYDGTDYSSYDLDATDREHFLKLTPEEQKILLKVAVRNIGSKRKWTVLPDEEAVWNKYAREGGYMFPMALAELYKNPRKFFNETPAVEMDTAMLLRGEPESQGKIGEGGVPRQPREAQEVATLQELRSLLDRPDNGLPEESKAVLRAMLDSPVMQYFTARPIRFRLVDYLRNLDARYDPARQLIELVRTADPLSGAHEFFHPLFEMLKQEDLDNLKRWRDEAIASELKTATGKDLEDLKKLAASEFSVRQFQAEGIDTKFYRYSSAEEYFAHMLTERWNQERIGVWGQAKDAMAAQDGFVAKVKELIRVIIEAIKRNVPGLRTQADALQRQILSGKYDVLPPSENILEQASIGGGGLGDIPLPYGLTQADVDAAGGIKQALEAAYERTKADAARERASDNWTWNIQNRRWGQVWSDYKQDPMTRNWRVVAGLEGDLKGLDVAMFRNEEAARQFAKDFREGRVFALQNNERWIRMVESAFNARPFNVEGTTPISWKEILQSRGRATGTTPEGQTFDINTLRERYEKPLQGGLPGREPQAMLESPEKIAEFVEPLEETRTPEKFREMASVLNKELINPAAATRFAALPEGVREELKDLFGGRIATHQEEAGPSFREVMRDPNLTPEEKSDYSRYALMEWQGFKADEATVKNRLATANRRLDELTLQAIAAIPETNEAEVRATNSLGQVLDKIKEEREKTAEGAQVNERIREGIDHLDALNDLLRSPVAMARALRGISELVGRRALTEERPGEEVLELISARSGFEGGVFATPGEWVRALARHLDQLRDPDGDRVIMAGEDVIEATLWMLRQRGDWKQELLEARMADDGTLRRFNAEYLNDLRARVPRGFDSILRQYATAQVEADALRSASNRLNRRIIDLEERRNNLQQGVDFINQHATDPTLKDFEKAMQETTGAISGMERTDDGWIMTLKHPLTGNDVKLNLGFEKGESQETLKMMAQLAEAGLEYGARPDADPLKAAWWRHFEENLHHPLMALNPNFDVLKDPSLLGPLDLIKEITKLKYFLLVESSLSKIPGMLPAQTTRALGAFASAVKAEYELARVFRTRMLNDNLIALRSHTNGLKDDVKTLRQWRDEVAGPIIDSLQHFGQITYREGDRIGGWGHVITAEDMKAVKSQYAYDQRLIKLSGGAEKIPAVREFQTMVKEPAVPGRKERSMDVLRLALSRGPGTTTRYLPDESRALPPQWKLAVERNGVDDFLNRNDNFIKLVLAHVLEDDRDYVMLGKGRFASDYKRIRQDEQELTATNRMPTNLQDLSQFIADLHNMHLGENEMPATAGDVRRALIEEVSGYMRKMQEDNEKKLTSARMGIVSYENEYTQARGGKVAPGTLYRYGITDPIEVIRKGNNALEPYVVRVRDYLKLVENALLEEKRKLLKTLNEVYGSESVVARMKAAKVITEGIGDEGPSPLQRHQMTLEELNANIDRVGKLLGNFNDIIRRREEFYGDDLISQLAKPMFDASVGTVLLSPTTWIVNRASGEVTWAMKLAEVMRGGWLRAGPTLLKNHVKTFMRAVQRQFVPKNDRERIIKSLMTDAMDPVAEQFTGLLADIQDWEQMRRSGVIDAYNYKDALGWDRERPLLQNLRGVLDALRDIRAEPNLSLRSEFFGRLGMLPRGWAALWRKVGMRQVDNSINVQAIAVSNSIAEMLRKRAIRSFDARLESDPKFRELYEQYGNNLKQFALHLLGEHHLGIMLTPAELTGRYNPLNMRKAAVMIRRMFARNNDPVDLVMLKYWWNQRHANGDRNAAFMTPGQRWALQFVLAEDANMATPNTRPTFFMGSRERQMLGVLSQWWLWNTDRMRDLYSKVRGQKTYAARYLPAVFGFLTATAVASLFGTTAGQKVNQALYNTLANTPSFWDAETDEERLKILTSISANYWGMIGSAIKMFTDTPGKLGYRNPVFLYNLATDIVGAAAKMWQSGDYTGPTLDLFARYNPVLRAAFNRLSGREGLVDLRNASNALRAATPDSLEARRRQPASGSDIRATPMTPLYNAILNAAMAGDWGTADEVFQRAVDQAQSLGIPNPEQAIVSAIRTRAPESAVFSRRLTDEERDLVYSRLSPAGREAVDKANSVFEELASRYGGGAGGGAGGAVGGARAAIAGMGGLRAGLPRSAALGGFIAGPGTVGLGGGGVPSLAPRPARSSFRSRSLARGRRTRNLLRPVLARPRVGRRLRRLAI